MPLFQRCFSLNKKTKKSFIAAAAAIIAVLLVSWIVWGNITVGTTHYKVVSNRLPASFNHYKIVVVSDLHNAKFGENNDQIIEKVQKENPDIIALTGDLVDSSKTDISIAHNLVKRLVEIAPCYYVTGNHEAWLGEQYQQLEKVLLEEGVVILHDSSVQLTKNNVTIQLAGLDDPDFTERDSSVQQSVLETKLNEMNLTEDYRVLLSHRPETFEAYVNENIDLVLSGHAHGGQFRIPFIGGIIAPNQGIFPKYDGGMYSRNNTTMVVSRGIGNSIIPVRLNNRPEIVSVELSCDE